MLVRDQSSFPNLTAQLVSRQNVLVVRACERRDLSSFVFASWLLLFYGVHRKREEDHVRLYEQRVAVFMDAHKRNETETNDYRVGGTRLNKETEQANVPSQHNPRRVYSVSIPRPL